MARVGKVYIQIQKRHSDTLASEIAKSWLLVATASPQRRLNLLGSECIRLQSLATLQELASALKVIRPNMVGQPFADVFLDSLKDKDLESEKPAFFAPLPTAVPAEKQREKVLQSKKKTGFSFYRARILLLYSFIGAGIMVGGIVVVGLTIHFYETYRGTVVPRSPPYSGNAGPKNVDAVFINSVDSDPSKCEAMDRLFVGPGLAFDYLRSQRWRRWIYREQVLVKNFAIENPDDQGDFVDLVDDESWKAPDFEARREIFDAWTSSRSGTEAEIIFESPNTPFWTSDVHQLSDVEIDVLREGDPDKTERLDKILYPEPTEYAIVRAVRAQNWDKAKSTKRSNQPFKK